jgi:hypothetical protein
MRAALAGGFRKVAADEVRVSTDTVDAWCVPPKALDGNGIPCPAQRFVDIQLRLEREGHPHPFSLLHNACRETGHLPPVRINASADPCSIDLVAKAVKEFGELLTAVSDARADGILSGEDAARIQAEGEQVYLALAPLLLAMQRVVVEDDEARVQRRRGPRRPLPQLLQLRRLAV